MEKSENLFKKYRWILLIVAVIVFLYIRMQDGKSYVPPVEGAEYISGCEKMVLDRIKSPSTAKFSDVTFMDGTPVGESISILGKLDSENSFGAMIRGSFGCEKKAGEDMTVIISE